MISCHLELRLPGRMSAFHVLKRILIGSSVTSPLHSYSLSDHSEPDKVKTPFGCVPVRSPSPRIPERICNALLVRACPNHFLPSVHPWQVFVCSNAQPSAWAHPGSFSFPTRPTLFTHAFSPLASRSCSQERLILCETSYLCVFSSVLWSEESCRLFRAWFVLFFFSPRLDPFPLRSSLSPWM